MLLQKLVEYGGRAPDKVPPRYNRTRVKYTIYLDAKGGRPSLVELSDGEVTGKKNRGKELIAPLVGKTSGIKANLLVDNAEYVLGIARDPDKADKVPGRHQRFIERVRDCAEHTDEPAVRAVLRFLESPDLGGLRIAEDFDPTANVSFTVTADSGDVRPVDLPAVQAYWASQKDGPVSDPVAAGSYRYECLACGTRGPIEKTLEIKLKGIPRGQGTGTALVSFNAPAFVSYGLEQSENAPICSPCAEAFSRTLNGLIAGPSSHYRDGAVQYVFWTREPTTLVWGSYFQQPDPQQVAALLGAAHDARQGATALDDTAFYAAALTASSGRAVVRDWLDVTVGEVRASLARYFEAQRLVDEYGQPGTPLPLWRLANATLRLDMQERPSARDRDRGAAPAIVPALMRFALAGTPLPASLLWNAVQRNRAEQRVLRVRAVLIKLVLRSRDRAKGATWMDELEPGSDDVAYHCGRLLAVIEQIQRAALGDINATVVDRFYGTASTAPISVFSRLVRGAQYHLAKLRRDRPGTYHALQSQLEEVLKPVSGFPSVLDLEQQGLFALGYYHQRAEDRRGRMQRAAERQAVGDNTGNAQ